MERLRDLYTRVNQLADSGDFDTIDTMLAEVPVTETDPEMLFGYLTITLPIKTLLPGRALFRQRVKDHLVVTLGRIRAEYALVGL